MQVTFFYTLPVSIEIEGHPLQLVRFDLFDVTAWTGERPAAPTQTNGAPVLSLAQTAASATDATGKIWVIPAGYYRVNEITA